ncbi:MAG TPA: flavodoxin family protein [Methanoregula sp.]|nr:flavodoxin family protein [Methanoregula sp.]
MDYPSPGCAGQPAQGQGDLPVTSLVVIFSYHHKNTEKVARVIANVLGAPVTTPQQVDPGEVAGYSLIGFGSGIYSGQHHKSLLDLADRLPHVTGRNAFIFSTYGAPEGMYRGDRLRKFVRDNHAALREKLEARGYTVLDEFACAGLNTNSFLQFFGGLNKGRPDAGDLMHAEEFAERIKQLLIPAEKT